MAPPASTRDFWERHAGTLSDTLIEPQLTFAMPLRAAAAGKTVLDCGSGAGALAGYLQGNAGRVVGIDYSAAMTRRARKLFPDVTFHHADVLTAQLGERFDIICGSAFLHEISDADTPALLAFLNRHLAAGGFCWLLENSFFNPLARFVRHHLVGHYGVPKFGSAHETPFDPARWERYRRAFRYATRSAEAFVAWERVWLYLIRRGPYESWVMLDRLCSRLPDVVKRNTSYIQNIYLSHDVPKRAAFAPRWPPR